MLRKLILSVSFVTLFLSGAFSQSCGTKIPEGFFRKLKSAVAIPGNEIDFNDLPYVDLSISVFQAGEMVPEIELNNMINALNDAFKPINISFTICSIDTVVEKGFRSIEYNRNEAELTGLYYSENTINLYLTDTLVSDAKSVCGYAYLPTPSPKDYVFIKKDCDLAKTLIHEMGHFFGLLHPHETEGGAELVDGSNCSVAGDLVCDTEASPNLSGMVSFDCEYTGSLVDANGDYFQPTVSNFMSYSLPDCTCRFTQGQYKRMVQYYRLNRSHLH